MDLETVIDELYALPRDEFIAARAAAVKQARQAGDELLAKRLLKLRKPSLAAWLANRLAREHPDEIGELLDLGADLRRAHARLDGRQLQLLSRERHKKIQGLRVLAVRTAKAAGMSASETILRQLEDSLTTALADADLAEELRAGRLESAGVTQTDWPASLVALAPAAPTKLRTAAPPVEKTTAKPDRGPTKEQRDRLTKAKKTAEHATTAVSVAQLAAKEAVAAAEEAAAEVDRLRKELQDARERQAQSAQEADTARRTLRQAEKAAAAAARELQAAELGYRGGR